MRKRGEKFLTLCSKSIRQWNVCGERGEREKDPPVSRSRSPAPQKRPNGKRGSRRQKSSRLQDHRREEEDKENKIMPHTLLSRLGDARREKDEQQVMIIREELVF